MSDTPEISVALYNLEPEQTIVPVEIVERMEREDNVRDIMQAFAPKEEAEPTINVPAKYWPGVSYTSAVGDNAPSLSEDQLEAIPVGVQDHAVNPEQAYKITGSEAHEVAVRIQKQSAHNIAVNAQKKRVSRRLLLAERSKKLTISCPVTGIVSLIEYPAIPYKSLVYSHPLSDLDNCRGIAQQGSEYLQRLDTQTLAGILIVLADDYELFKFQPFDSGAQKNAILRTASKEHIISGIIMIESLIHSGNAKYLPKLAMTFDKATEDYGMLYKMQNYLKLLADAIAKPDKEAYDPNAVKKVGRPVYIKDVDKAERKVSFLARQEVAAAKKQYAEDRKAGKVAIIELCKAEKVTDKLKNLLAQLMVEDALFTVPSIWIDKICEKLETYSSDYAKKLIEIMKRDRKALLLDVSELEEAIQKEQAEDEPTPGNEEAIADTPRQLEDHTGIDSEYMGSDLEESATVEAAPAVEEASGLTGLALLLWKKKNEVAKARSFIQNDLPSVTSYFPSVTKENLGKDQK